MNETRTIFFVGKPGCGKGTQAKLLAEHTGWPIFASGVLFRTIAAEDTPVGRKTKEVDVKGHLQPPWFAMYLYLKSLFSIPDERSAIFDGFNRKVPEAELIVDSMQWLGRPFQIINIVVSDEEIRHRLALRAQTSGRVDDHEVDERIKEYYTYTDKAIEVFKRAGVLIEINGEQAPEKIAEDVRAALNI